jgi:dipeptidase E
VTDGDADSIAGPTPERHVVAIGGGGMGDEAGDHALRTYLLALTSKREPKLCFVGTASGDDDAYADSFARSFDGMRCEVSRLTVLKPMDRSTEDHLAAQDVVYVGGGNAFYMLVLWRAYGVDAQLRRAWERGAVMCGVSAGSMCWFDDGIRAISVSEFEPLSPFLGLLPGSSCPHYSSQPARRDAYLAMVGDGRLPPGYAIGDGAALHFVGTDLAETVTFRPNAAAYRVQRVGERPVETPLPSRPL